ncbi:hypothetical protein B0T10DRAFT_417984 [Thelonectria olida]|uniref:Uncharacterized protein n=1 Tax=Thelonectria olida TaxID=1576542 RepID=A0A9P8VQT5_9HYPO|nr:hypothetical protein B0T10DRAFT_417984 [Thelonectria olida]
MYLDMDEIHWVYSTAAASCSWFLLAGYLISPSTYTSISESDTLNNTGKVGKSLMKAVQNVPLIVIASVFCFVATSGLVFLWRQNQNNYFWVKRYVVIPVLTNSAMGLISTILNIYTVREGQWSITAIITASIIGAWLLFSLAVFVAYDGFLIPGLEKNRNDRALQSSIHFCLQLCERFRDTLKLRGF